MYRAALLLCLTACGGGLEFTDDVDLTLDLAPRSPFADPGLHTPYVRGAPVTIRVHSGARRRLAGAAVVSSDEDVFSVLSVAPAPEDEEEVLVVEGRAAGAGVAELQVLHDGEVWGAVEVEVGFPTRSELHASGPMFVDLDGLEAVPKVLVDGTATFQVRYFDGDRELYGNDTLTVASGEEVLAQTEQTWLFENREWVRVTPTTAGLHEVDLFVDGELLETVEVEAVLTEAVDEIAIFGRDESQAEAGDWMVLLAQGSGGGDRIFGGTCTWVVDGVEQPGEGDLFRYEYLPDSEASVVAAFGDLEASVVANVGEGYVDSSNGVGCNAAAVPPAWALLLGVLPWVRRRRT